jgi:site-specific recombinase XerD
MSIPQNFITPNNNYLPATLRENKSGWVIEYYALHPQKQVLQRKQIRIKRIKQRYSKKTEAKRHALEICETINQKLRGGWSPFFEGENARLYEKLQDVIGYYLTEKKRELRENTMRSYQSFCRQFEKWANKNLPKNTFCSLINHNVAIRFMDDFYNKNVNARSYNNMLKGCRALFCWCVEKGYSNQNAFEKIKVKKEQKKTRTIVPPEFRADITKYLLDTQNYGFALVLNLVYSSLIRPNEIRHIQIKDVNIAGKYVVIPCEVAKNHKQRFSALSEKSIELLKMLNFDKFPKNYYLLGGELAPSEAMCGAARYRHEWDKITAKLHIPKNMQLYSFRDTGIYEMLKSGIDNLTVMQHADHSDLSITTRYANHADSRLIVKINQNVPAF